MHQRHVPKKVSDKHTTTPLAAHLSVTAPHPVSAWLSPRRFVCETLWKEVSTSSLVVFRVLWGIIMFYESLTYVWAHFSKLHAIIDLDVHYRYWGFEWVCSWHTLANDLNIAGYWPLQTTGGDESLNWTELGVPYGINLDHAYVILMAVCALCITLGLFYRVACVLFFLCFTWLFLQEMTTYLNHFYLVCTMSLVLVFLPAHNTWSLDVVLGVRSRRHGRTVPFWAIFVVRALLFVVYTSAATAKLNEDWLRGEPLLHWLPRRAHLPLLGPLLTLPVTAYVFSWGGLLLDALLCPALLVHTPRAVRWVAWIACCGFHLTNKLVFNIGIFPWVMLASTSIYFDPNWPERLWWGDRRVPRHAKETKPVTTHNWGVMVLLMLFLLLQIAMPLRHWVHEGNVAWNEEGHRWSWRMKLRNKEGVSRFWIRDPLLDANATSYGALREIHTEMFLTGKQQRKTSCRPELIIQTAHIIADRYTKKMARWKNGTSVKNARPQVFAESVCSLNYRPWQFMVCPTTNLAACDRGAWHHEWVEELIPLHVIVALQAEMTEKNVTQKHNKWKRLLASEPKAYQQRYRGGVQRAKLGEYFNGKNASCGEKATR